MIYTISSRISLDNERFGKLYYQCVESVEYLTKSSKILKVVVAPIIPIFWFKTSCLPLPKPAWFCFKKKKNQKFETRAWNVWTLINTSVVSLLSFILSYFFVIRYSPTIFQSSRPQNSKEWISTIYQRILFEFWSGGRRIKLKLWDWWVMFGFSREISREPVQFLISFFQKITAWLMIIILVEILILFFVIQSDLSKMERIRAGKH